MNTNSYEKHITKQITHSAVPKDAAKWETHVTLILYSDQRILILRVSSQNRLLEEKLLFDSEAGINAVWAMKKA